MRTLAHRKNTPRKTFNASARVPIKLAHGAEITHGNYVNAMAHAAALRDVHITHAPPPCIWGDNVKPTYTIQHKRAQSIYCLVPVYFPRVIHKSSV